MALRTGPEWSRRKFLGMSALGAVGLTACGGGPPAAPQVDVQVPQAILDAAAPYRGGSVGMLSQKLYSEAANQALDRSLQAFAQATGTTVQNDLVSGDAGDMVAKMDAEVKAGTTRDLAFMSDERFVGQLQNLGDLEDVTDVVEEMKALYGEPATEATNFCVFNGRWYAIPYHFIAAGMFLRKDWYAEKGLPLKPTYTWEELRDNALAVSDPAQRRFGWGITINRSGDANGFIESVINAYGGAIADNTGQRVVFNSPETVEAVSFIGDIYTNPKYEPMLPPGIESWTDTGNNENWLAGIIGLTNNQYSIYADSKTKGNPVYGNTHPFNGAIGPALDRPLAFGSSNSFVVFKGAKNPDLAKQVAKFMVSGSALLGVAQGAPCLVNPSWEKVWDSDPYYTNGDPAYAAIREQTKTPIPLTTATGYAFPQPPSPGEQAAVAAYLLTDMMQSVVQGTAPAEAVATTHDRMVQIFEQQGYKQ
ncbi:multiple sugar transport system substrate-binding protein [Pseudonocardia hierapolitana]|uniref:Multiple sugar transport system substrate-binding protein n=1 Tax=Pseudonocardia hierapolitana TaxID=1128676 RepID=A0A561SQR2_9PSEU|nr:extracellular solute-binding protein [Pseudonocardia hierapolitana]TWF77186.1 multiple sugar transport system substrate-binding protein [Pseudonocardia hierapolitana]